jgi:hypothetical protein
VGESTETVMLQLEDPIWVIEWSGDTRRDGEPDGWELLHGESFSTVEQVVEGAIVADGLFGKPRYKKGTYGNLNYSLALVLPLERQFPW